MEHAANWNALTASRIGERVAYFRKQVGDKGITAQALADRCAKLGHPLDRTVIAKLEKGMRQSVTVADLLVLSAALGVPPIALVVPVDQEETVEMLPGRNVPTYEAMTWFTGERRFPGASGSAEDTEDPAMIRTYRAHAKQVDSWNQQTGQAARWAAAAEDDPAAEARATWYAAAIPAVEEDIARARRELRRYGLRLPELPAGLAHIDQDEGGGR